MPDFTFHFLNVKQGDCTLIEHGSGRKTVVDVCNASEPTIAANQAFESYVQKSAAGIPGNFQQKKHPVNPIEYLHKHGIYSIWRFILTHPDMDHMDGLKPFCSSFSPTVFWDTDNEKEIEFGAGSPYDEEDWRSYKNIRDTKPGSDPQRMTTYSGYQAKYYNQNEDGTQGGDYLSILAPTPELLADANERDDYNDASYVLLYRAGGGKILLGGDSHDKTWEHILDKYKDLVTDVDLLIAPHHGRKSGRDYSFLDTVNPKMTFFGNASSEHLAYSAWSNRGLEYITNNQANCMVVRTNGPNLTLYVTYENYARKRNPNTFYDSTYQAWYCGEII